MPFFKYFLVECSNYKFLIESNRARTYFNTSTVLCDTSLSGWHRFSGKAGNQMADSCVDYKHCGTAAPGWINGGHPSVADRVVSRTVCFRSKSNCCKWSIVISVRNCGGFFVYWLHRPPHCNFRYCGSGIQPTSGTKREEHEGMPLASGLSLWCILFRFTAKIRTLPFAFAFMLSDLCVHGANPRTSQASLNTFWYKNWGAGGSTSLHWQFDVLQNFKWIAPWQPSRF